MVFNATVLNGMGVTGRLQGPPSYKALDNAGKHIQLNFEHSEVGGGRPACTALWDEPT